MKKLTRTQNARWENAKRLVRQLIALAGANNALILAYGEIIDIGAFTICDDLKFISYGPKHKRVLIMSADPEFDYGLELTMKQFEKQMRDNFKLVTITPW